MITPRLIITEVKRDGELLYQAKCPECNTWADLDDDQLTGQVSSECQACPLFHATVNWLADAWRLVPPLNRKDAPV